MVLNIPFPPTHTLTNKQSTLLCQAQQASCDVVLRASYLPDANNRANKGCRQRVTIGQAAEVTVVQPEIGKRLLLVTASVIKAFNILKASFSASRPVALVLWRWQYSSSGYSFSVVSLVIGNSVHCGMQIVAAEWDIWLVHSWCCGRPQVWKGAQNTHRKPNSRAGNYSSAVPDWLPRGCMRDFWQLSHTQKVISSTRHPWSYNFTVSALNTSLSQPWELTT